MYFIAKICYNNLCKYKLSPLEVVGKMRSLENVTQLNVKTTLSFAARALADERISPQQYDEIRKSFLAAQEVVNTALKGSQDTKFPKTVQHRRRRSSQMLPIQAPSPRKEQKEIRIS